MSLNESRRTRRRERWPLEFDLEGIPQDTKHRRRLVEMKRRESEEEKETEMSNNSFAVDKLSAADREALLTALMRERPAGREIDLSKPVVGRYVHQEYDKMLYHHGSGHVLVVRDAREEAAAAKRGYVTEPSPNHDYSKLSGSNHAALKLNATREETPLSAAELVALDEQDFAASQPIADDSVATDPEASSQASEAEEDTAERPSRRGRNR